MGPIRSHSAEQNRPWSISPAALYAAIVPITGLALLALATVLYNFDYAVYRRTLTGIGIEPFRYPFLDWEGISAAIVCWKNGIDVYQVNPCDVLGRAHGFYSPLWLQATFIPSGPFWRNLIGLALDISFLASLFAVMKPKNWREALLFLLSLMSTMVVFALERANVDLLLFLIFVGTGFLFTGSTRSRIVAYALILFAGLLKFYPLVALLMALRERPRLSVGVALMSACIVLSIYFGYRGEFDILLRDIPHGFFISDMFGASNLPTGLAFILDNSPLISNQQRTISSETARIASITLLTLFAAIQATLISRNADYIRCFEKTSAREKYFLVTGSLLMAGCFFAAQNIGYRGIFLLFVLAGVTGMRRNASDSKPARAKLQLLQALIVFLMWGEAFRAWLKNSGIAVEIAFWFVREAIWWQMIATLLAIFLIFAARANTVVDLKRQLLGFAPARTIKN